jgi:hypothetical protein
MSEEPAKTYGTAMRAQTPVLVLCPHCGAWINDLWDSKEVLTVGQRFDCQTCSKGIVIDDLDIITQITLKPEGSDQ